MVGAYTASKFEFDPRPGRDFASRTIIELLEEAATAHPDKVAFYKPHQDRDGDLVVGGDDFVHRATHGVLGPLGAVKHSYGRYTWKKYRDLVMDAAAAFISMGLQPMDAVNIRGVNSPEWLIAFLGCIAAGGLPVGLYPTDSPDTLEFKAKDSGAAFVVVAKADDLHIYSKFIDNLPSVKAVILWDGKFLPESLPLPLVKKLHTPGRPLLLWEDFVARGRGRTAVYFRALVHERVADTKPGQAAAVVYTSGTTGKPKGVMLSHDSMTWVAELVQDHLLKKAPPRGEHRIMSYLPLNHVAGLMLDVMFPLVATLRKGLSVSTFFPATCYLKKRCIPEQLRDASPTLFLGVPEVWDGMRLKIEHATRSGYKKWLKEMNAGMILGKLGLGDVMYALTGAGPITKDTLSYFHDMGINIVNIFGQSESAALGALWQPDDFDKYNVSEKFGSIGRSFGNSLKFDTKTNEIMLKGRNIMLGYMNQIDKTREAITEDGWLKTGDKGEADGDGFVSLVGRLREIMKTAGGEMVAPVPVEEGVKRACNAKGQVVKQVVVVGDGAYYLSALLTLVESATDGLPTGELLGAAQSVDPAATTVGAARRSTVWADTLSKCISEYNARAAKGPERVWRYAVLPADITAESAPDLMTPTFKIKRDGLSKMYTELVKTCGGLAEDGPPGPMGGVKACGAK